MLRDIGIIELLLIALVILIIFGGGKLPVIGRFMGRIVRDFREGMNSDGSKEPKLSRPAAPVSPTGPRSESPASLNKASAPAPTAVKPADLRRAMYPLVEEAAPLQRNTAPAPTVTIQVSFSPPVKTTPNPSTVNQTLPAQQAVSNSSTSLVTRIKNFFRSFGKSK